MKKFFLVIISTSFSLLYCELLIHASGYRPAEYSWQWAVTDFFNVHPLRIYALSKGVQSKENIYANIDAFGFRYDPADGNQAPSAKSVFLFGDSFVYGHVMNDDQTFPYITQTELRKTGNNTDIVNAGVPGYGLDQTFLYIQEVIKTYHPQTIVWNINTNDIGDSNDACLFASVGGRMTRLPTWLQTLYLQGLVVRKAPSFVRNSYLVNLYLRFLQHGDDRHTIGCTLPDEHTAKINERALEKLRYMFGKLEEEADKEHIQLIYTLLPVEYYFDTSGYSNEVNEMKQYFLLRNELRRYKSRFIDFNELFAKIMFPDVLADRDIAVNNIAYRALFTDNPNVLGETHIDYTSLFLPGETDMIGIRHLNQKGNEILGSMFADLLEPCLIAE